MCEPEHWIPDINNQVHTQCTRIYIFFSFSFSWIALCLNKTSWYRLSPNLDFLTHMFQITMTTAVTRRCTATSGKPLWRLRRSSDTPAPGTLSCSATLTWATPQHSLGLYLNKVRRFLKSCVPVWKHTMENARIDSANSNQLNNWLWTGDLAVNFEVLFKGLNGSSWHLVMVKYSMVK